MKQILFKIQQFPHLSETFIINQINLAFDSGFKVNILVKDVLNFEDCGHQDILNKHNLSNRIIIDDYKIPNNKILRLFKSILIILKYGRKWKNFYEYIKLKPTFSLTWIYEIGFYQKLRNFDIIHVQYGTNVHPVDLLKKTGWLDSRLIVSFHGHDAFFPINGFIQNNGYYQHLFEGDNMIVANTPYLAKVISSLGCPDQNLEVIPVGVDTDFFRPPESKILSEKLRLITVGRLDSIKGHEYAIEAINQLIERRYNVELLIIGEGHHREYLENKIKHFQLQESVKLLGKRNQGTVRECLQQSDVFLFTSVPLKDGRRETQGLATLEAQACGLPVVAFDSGGIKYTFRNGDNGFLCKEYDIKCLTDKIEILLDHDVRLAMGRRSLAFVKKYFSKEKINSRWEKVYNAE